MKTDIDMAPKVPNTAKKETPAEAESFAVKRIFPVAAKCLLIAAACAGVGEGISWIARDRSDVAQDAIQTAVLAAVNKNDCMIASVANQHISYNGFVDVARFDHVEGSVKARVGSIGADGKDGSVTYRLSFTDDKTGKPTYTYAMGTFSRTCADEILSRFNPRPDLTLSPTPTPTPGIR